MPEIIRTKVCIVGAGPGGALASLALSKLGVEHVIIDKATFPRDKICGDACSGKVVEALKKINPSLVEKIIEKNEIQVPSWGVKFIAPNRKELRAPFKPNYKINSDTPPGFISKRLDFDNFLVEELKSHKEALFIEDYDVSEYIKDDKGWTVSGITNSAIIHAPILLIADGAHSQFTKKIAKHQIDKEHHAAGLRAYYENVEGMDEENFIELHFIKSLLPGYFWIFPLPNGGCNVGLGIRSDIVGKKKLNLKKELQEIIENDPVISKRFKNARLVDKVYGWGLPLGSIKRKLSGDGYMLLGDAASLIDPFTGEGIGNAMLSGYIAADVSKLAIEENNYSEEFMTQYDEKIYKRFWSEFNLSRQLQQLSMKKWLFNFVINRAVSNKTLSETISCMFTDLDIREQFRKPSFYIKMLFNR